MKKLKFALLALSMGLGIGVSAPTVAAPDPDYCISLLENCQMGNIFACKEYHRRGC